MPKPPPSPPPRACSCRARGRWLDRAPLAGCDRLTISPALLGELAEDDGALSRCLDPDTVAPAEPDGALPARALNEARFRWSLNDNPMACDLLSDGIRRFAADQRALESLLTAEDIAA